MSARNIVVVNSKGGCGKTTIATNLAGFFATRNARTVLVDEDPQRSSIEWLEQRPDWRAKITGIEGTNRRYPAGTHVAIIDSPARLHGRLLSDTLRSADLIIVPLLPSPIDMRAGKTFIAELLNLGTIRGKRRRIAVVANRVRENVKIFVAMQSFLRRLETQHVATLRDTQHYIRAAAQGVSLFELAPSLVAKDLDQWKPLCRWASRRKL